MSAVFNMRDAAADPVPEARTATAAAATPATAPPARGQGLPTTLLALSLLVVLGHHAWQAEQDRQALVAAHAGQQQTVDNATRLRGSLDALAADTQRLADAGNPNARVLVEELRKRGITIHAPVPAPAAKDKP